MRRDCCAEIDQFESRSNASFNGVIDPEWHDEQVALVTSGELHAIHCWVDRSLFTITKVVGRQSMQHTVKLAAFAIVLVRWCLSLPQRMLVAWRLIIPVARDTSTHWVTLKLCSVLGPYSFYRFGIFRQFYRGDPIQ